MNSNLTTNFVNTRTIFDTWSTYPSIFLDSKILIQKQLKPKIVLPASINPFYCGPDKINNISVVTSLTKVMGIRRGDKISLKTDYISTSKETLYNGFKLSLELKNDEVFIVVKKGKTEPTKIKGWSVSRILSSMVQKNPSLIDESIVKTLLSNGSLKMKFNVSEIKNHGTSWRL